MPTSPNAENFTLGKGVVSFNQKKDGVYQGFRDLGNAPELTLNIDISKLAHYSSRSGIRAKDKEAIQEVTPTMTFSLDEITDKNFAMSLLGEGVEITQAAQAVTSAEVSVTKLDQYYELGGERKLDGLMFLKYGTEVGTFTVGDTVTGATSGASATIDGVFEGGAASSDGVLVISGLTGIFQNGESITDTGTGDATLTGLPTTVNSDSLLVMDLTDGVTIFESGTDYFVSSFDGKINVKKGGSITDATTLTCVYSVPEATFTQISMLDQTEVEGQFHFVSDNAAGRNYELLAWRLSLTPNGDVALIGDDWSTLSYSGEILKDEAGHPAEPYCRMVVDTTA